MDWKMKLDSFEASQSWCKSLLFKLIFSPEMNVGLLCFVLCIWSVLWKFQKPSHFRNFQRKLQMPPSKQTQLAGWSKFSWLGTKLCLMKFWMLKALIFIQTIRFLDKSSRVWPTVGHVLRKNYVISKERAYYYRQT